MMIRNSIPDYNSLAFGRRSKKKKDTNRNPKKKKNTDNTSSQKLDNELRQWEKNWKRKNEKKKNRKNPN